MSKTLVYRPTGGLGDILMMTPAIRGVAKKIRDKLDVAIPEKYNGALDNISYLSNIIYISEGEQLESVVEKTQHKKSNVIDLSSYEYDYIYSKPNLINIPKPELFCQKANIPYTNSKLDIILTDEEILQNEKLLNEIGTAPKKFILLGVNAKSSKRSWTVNKWDELANKISKLGYKLIVEGPEGTLHGNNILHFDDSKYSIRETYALVYNAALTVTNDSGLLHISGAFATPNIAIYSGTNPLITSIYENSHFIAPKTECHPCGNFPCITNSLGDTKKTPDCLNLISADDVGKKVREVLNYG